MNHRPVDQPPTPKTKPRFSTNAAADTRPKSIEESVDHSKKASDTRAANLAETRSFNATSTPKSSPNANRQAEDNHQRKADESRAGWSETGET